MSSLTLTLIEVKQDVVDELESMVKQKQKAVDELKPDYDKLKKERDAIDKKKARKAWNEADKELAKVGPKYEKQRDWLAKTKKQLRDYKAGKPKDMTYEVGVQWP